MRTSAKCRPPARRVEVSALPVGRAGRDRRDCARLTRSADRGCPVPSTCRGGEGVYLVGGAVRDLLLGRESFDVDLAVEGDAIEFARGAGRRGDRARPVRHRSRPLSGREAARRGHRAAARRTRRPAALPDVEAGTIEDDLARRDFTVNAMAASLGERLRAAGRPARRPRRPRGTRRSAILHDRSFVDDPTRIFRAVRYESRLGFRMDEETERLAREGVAGIGAALGRARARGGGRTALRGRGRAVARPARRVRRPPRRARAAGSSNGCDALRARARPRTRRAGALRLAALAAAQPRR